MLLHWGSHLPDALLHRSYVVTCLVGLGILPILSDHHVLELRSQACDALLTAIKLQQSGKDIQIQVMVREYLRKDSLRSRHAARPG